MARRLKVLISAYACEPGKGSEPEVGWQWAMQMAVSHDVTILTRSNNRPAIEKGLAALPPSQALPAFVYHDRDPFLLGVKKRLKAIKLYYLLWQRSAHSVVKQLNETHQFDLMHHVTFAAFRCPTAVWGHGVPVIWGPVGGITSIPFGLLPWGHPVSLAHELLRSVSNMIQAAPYFSLPGRGRASTVILASTVEMHAQFLKLGLSSEIMPAIGLETQSLPFRSARNAQEDLSVSSFGGDGEAPFVRAPLKLLFVGKVVTLKGIDLAIDALAKSETKATLAVVGDGNYLEAARRQAHKLGLADRITFEGRLSREQALARYSDFDVFLFPSLHDTGGHAVIEAMFNELPVICLDCGGPAVAVERGCGVKVPLGTRRQLIDRLAMAIRFYNADRSALLHDGKKARERILRHYDWQRKGLIMEERYKQAVTARTEEQRAPGRTALPQFERGARMLNLLFSLRGIAVSLAGLALVAALFVLSLGHLKRQAQKIVLDDLPGLSYSGEANSTLAESFDRTLLLMLNQPAERRAQLEHEIEILSARTMALLESYKQTIFTPDDQAFYDKVVDARGNYLRVREEILRLVNSGELQTAANDCQSRLLPAYTAYKEAADKLFESNIQSGKTSSESIMRTCTETQILVAVIGMLIFIAGFLIGISR